MCVCIYIYIIHMQHMCTLTCNYNCPFFTSSQHLSWKKTCHLTQASRIHWIQETAVLSEQCRTRVNLEAIFEDVVPSLLPVTKIFAPENMYGWKTNFEFLSFWRAFWEFSGGGFCECVRWRYSSWFALYDGNGDGIKKRWLYRFIISLNPIKIYKICTRWGHVCMYMSFLFGQVIAHVQTVNWFELWNDVLITHHKSLQKSHTRCSVHILLILKVSVDQPLAVLLWVL